MRLFADKEPSASAADSVAMASVRKEWRAQLAAELREVYGDTSAVTSSTPGAMTKVMRSAACNPFGANEEAHHALFCSQPAVREVELDGMAALLDRVPVGVTRLMVSYVARGILCVAEHGCGG